MSVAKTVKRTFSLFVFTGQHSKMDTISFGALCDFMEDLRESKENKKKIGKYLSGVINSDDFQSKYRKDCYLSHAITYCNKQIPTLVFWHLVTKK